MILLNQCLQNSTEKKPSGNKDANGEQAEGWEASS